MKLAKPVFREKVGHIWSDITVDISPEPCDPLLPEKWLLDSKSNISSYIVDYA